MSSIWSWLNSPSSQDDLLGPLPVAYLIVFTMGFVISAYLAGPDAEHISGLDPQSVGTRHWANVGLWIFGPGLFLFGIRILQINPLSLAEPVWLVGCVIALLVTGVRCVAWRRSTKPTTPTSRESDTGSRVISR